VRELCRVKFKLIIFCWSSESYAHKRGWFKLSNHWHVSCQRFIYCAQPAVIAEDLMIAEAVSGAVHTKRWPPSTQSDLPSRRSLNSHRLFKCKAISNKDGQVGRTAWSGAGWGLRLLSLGGANVLETRNAANRAAATTVAKQFVLIPSKHNTPGSSYVPRRIDGWCCNWGQTSREQLNNALWCAVPVHSGLTHIWVQCSTYPT
jgi:hypothetical protein